MLAGYPLAAELQLPSTKFDITYRRSCEVLQIAELIAQAAEHIRQRLINLFQGQRKLNAARHSAGKKFRFGLALRQTSVSIPVLVPDTF